MGIQIEIAGIPVEIICHHPENEDFFQDYLTDKEPVFIVVNDMKDLIEADTFKIEMKNPYSPVYMTCIDEAKNDLRANARPELVNYIDNLDAYQKALYNQERETEDTSIRLPRCNKHYNREY